MIANVLRQGNPGGAHLYQEVTVDQLHSSLLLINDVCSYGLVIDSGQAGARHHGVWRGFTQQSLGQDGFQLLDSLGLLCLLSN